MLLLYKKVLLNLFLSKKFKLKLKIKKWNSKKIAAIFIILKQIKMKIPKIVLLQH